MQRRWLEAPRGILQAGEGLPPFELERLPPSAAFAPFVARHWILRWDLAAPHAQTNIPYPCVNLVLERSRSGVLGVPSKGLTRVLEGRGLVFGVKFLPGAFRPWYGRSVAALTDRFVPLVDVFGACANAWADDILARTSPTAMRERAEALLEPYLPPRDAAAAEALRIVEIIVDDRTLTKVDELVRKCGVGKRSLQRLFRAYVGVGPKWVIQRYRLQEAAQAAESGHAPSWAALAADLGYADQAHFIRDFKRFVGRSPTHYALASAAE